MPAALALRLAERRAQKSANGKGVAVTMEAQRHGGRLKRTESVPVPMSPRDMLTLLQDVALGTVEASTLQVRAAVATVQYTNYQSLAPRTESKTTNQAAVQAARLLQQSAARGMAGWDGYSRETTCKLHELDGPLGPIRRNKKGLRPRDRVS